MVWGTPAGSGVTGGGSYAVDIHAGTLKGGVGDFSFFFGSVSDTLVEAGATLDLAGQAVMVPNLHGKGSVVSTSGPGELDLVNATFAGHIEGAITATVLGTVVLTGTGTFDEIIVNSATLDLSGSASENVHLMGASTLILRTPDTFTGDVEGFSTDTDIDLTGIDFGVGTTRSYDKHAHMLTVTDGTHTANITFDGDYVKANFVLSDDGDGGTRIHYATAAHHPEADWPLAG